MDPYGRAALHPKLEGPHGLQEWSEDHLGSFVNGESDRSVGALEVDDHIVFLDPDYLSCSVR